MDFSSMSIKEVVQTVTANHYEELARAREEGRIIAWASSVAPQEFMEAMDIAVAYPENHAAAIASKGGAPALLEHAEEMGFNNDICAYARLNLAYADRLESGILEIPRPDFVIACTNICNTLIKWYENLAKMFQVPFLLVDTPFCAKGDCDDSAVDYVKGQFTHLIAQLEEICGRPFDYDRFTQVMEVSGACNRAWFRAMSATAYVPSPMDGFNILNYMALAVCQRGRQETVDVFHFIADEMERMHENGESQFKGEQKYRYLWEGIAVWPYLSHTYKTLKDQGAIYVGSLYPATWDIAYGVWDLDAMAKSYVQIPPNCCLKQQIETRKRVLAEKSCDGIIYHVNRSCKLLDFMQHGLRGGVYEATGLPYAMFSGDQADPSAYSKAQFEVRMEALVESMAARKDQKGERA